MKKLFFLIILFFAGIVYIKADETPIGDGEFVSSLSQLRNPFIVTLPPKPIVAPKPPEKIEVPKEIPKVVKRRKVFHQVVLLPGLKLEGVVVGEEMSDAIINDRVVPLHGMIMGARVVSVSRDGVGLIFKGRKFILKTD